MDNEILDSIEKPKDFLNEYKSYRCLLSFIWLLLGVKLIYKGLYKLHQYSESLRGRGLLVIYDPTPNLSECFEPVTLGILCIGIVHSIVRNSENRPKLLLLYLSVYTIFFIQGYSLNGAWLPLIPFLGVLKFSLSLKESLLILFSCFGLILLVYLTQKMPLKHIIKMLITPDKILLVILLTLSFWKYYSSINSFLRIKVTVFERLFLVVSLTPWILSFLFNLGGLKQGAKFFF